MRINSVDPERGGPITNSSLVSSAFLQAPQKSFD